MKIYKKVIRKVCMLFHLDDRGRRQFKLYYKRYCDNAFDERSCKNIQQYEASITRLYHTIEKGLSYEDYRPGFGKDNVEKILNLLEKYAEAYDTEKFFYRTALSTLNEYVKRNKEHGWTDAELEKKVSHLRGTPNSSGGAFSFEPMNNVDLGKVDFETLLMSRHSTRHFSDETVEKELIKKAIMLAQHTPSACNRQGWKTRIVLDKEKISEVLKNQNGNRGFGHEIDKLLLVTSDLRYFNRERELFQGFIDGGMYAMNLLNALFYEGVATVPLSASLSKEQESSVREILDIDNAEILILFIGCGKYPRNCKTTKSERKEAEIIVV